MIELLFALVSGFAAFCITMMTLPFLIVRIRARNLVAKDMNKLERPFIPELGGVAVIFGFAFGIMFALGLYRILDIFPKI